MSHTILFLIHMLPIFLIAEKTFQTNNAVKEYNRLKQEFDNLSSAPSQSSPIENFSFQRDVAVFTFSKGTLYALPSISDSVHALLFIGKGSMAFTPPTEVERKQMFRFYEKESFMQEFNTLFCLFTDSTYQELSKVCSFTPGENKRDVETTIKKSLRIILNNDKTEYAFDIFRAFLFNDNAGMFFAHFYENTNRTFYFHIDPYEVEEVSFGRNRESGAVFSSSSSLETVTQFHTQENYTNTTLLVDEVKPNIDILHYTIKNSIAKNLAFSSECTVSFTSQTERRKWIPFILHGDLTIDSILWENGKNAEFVRIEKSPFLWLYTQDGFPKDQFYKITLYYHGKLIDNNEGWFSLRSSFLWYPNSLTARDKATFDLTFHTPSQYQFASIGEKKFYTTSDEITTSQWMLKSPGRNASFMIGNFTEYSVTPDSTPPITVFISNAHNAQLKNRLARGGILSGKNMDKQVAGDIENSIRFFQHVYGKTDVNQFYATEIPGNHGEAFPGLVHLSWLTFQNTETDGSDEIFRAHEVAHQWWAIGVDFKTYHDQWLSEAFATYSGMWYMQTVLRDNDKFFDQLRKYKKSILSNRKYIFGSGQESGPIWLGYRTSSSSTEGDYSLIIYKKGAWILHMLRNMSLELKTMNENIFQSMIKDFYQTYKGKYASTEDFQHITEKHFGMPMDWFFKQWVYNVEIPKYHITYKLEKLENGKFKVRCTVKQSNVPEDFQMYIPFLIDFGEGRIARVKYLIKGPITEFDFPVLPIKPKEITFNDLESVLCEIDDEDWD